MISEKLFSKRSYASFFSRTVHVRRRTRMGLNVLVNGGVYFVPAIAMRKYCLLFCQYLAGHESMKWLLIHLDQHCYTWLHTWCVYKTWCLLYAPKNGLVRCCKHLTGPFSVPYMTLFSISVPLYCTKVYCSSLPGFNLFPHPMQRFHSLAIVLISMIKSHQSTGRQLVMPLQLTAPLWMYHYRSIEYSRHYFNTIRYIYWRAGSAYVRHDDAGVLFFSAALPFETEWKLSQ